MDPDSKRLHVSVTDGRGRPLRAGDLARWLEAAAPGRARGEVAVALVSDARVRALNRRYRRADRATDVLAFPIRPVSLRGHRLDAPRSNAGSVGLPTPAIPTDRDPSHPGLGDIVIASGMARRQAREAGHSYATELRVLALHGLLHLMGYDHHDPMDRGRMARTEARLRRKHGLPAGLIERSRGGASGVPYA